MAYSQVIPQPIVDIILPCALESGSSPQSLAKIQSGDLSDIKELYGCFTDCISRKLGIITDDDAFHLNIFQDHVKQVVKPELVTLISEQCVDKVGSTKCTYTGTLYRCLVDIIWGSYFS
uniref:Putative odorant-binding protein 56e obp n=1 Tax=Nyssomyia neivai TaxID=330878 RepID=A0A1L8DPM8_9DIPT